MFFKSSKYNNLKASPLEYWEEKSYILVVFDNEEEILSNIIERVSKIEGVKILSKNFLTENGTLMLKIEYKSHKYDVGFFLTSYKVPPFYLKPSINFSKEEIEQISKATMALSIFMAFSDNPKESYHLQLKLAVNIIPNALTIIDESSEKILPIKWVKMLATSKVLPSSSDLYTIQAINHKSGEVWFHTHGLSRCYLTELEILGSNQKNFIGHYNIINTFASYLIDKIAYQDYACIGVLKNRELIVVTYVKWMEGLKEYRNVKLGNLKDRINSHNSNTSIIFVYKNEEDAKKKKLSKVNIYDDLLQDNPLFFVSDKETSRMKELAIERFNYVKDAFKNKDNEVNIKIGLLIDSEDNYEHIWFKLLEIKGKQFKAELLQEPYDVKKMHKGDTVWFKIDDITDWIIYTKNFSINPNNVYLLEKDNNE